MFVRSKPRYRRKNFAQAVAIAAILSAVSALPASAGMDEAMVAYQAKDYTTALQEFSALAKTGDAKAEYYMGRIYHYGEGVTTSGAENTGTPVSCARAAGGPVPTPQATIATPTSAADRRAQPKSAAWSFRTADLRTRARPSQRGRARMSGAYMNGP